MRSQIIHIEKPNIVVDKRQAYGTSLTREVEKEIKSRAKTIVDRLERSGDKAVRRVVQLIESEDENVATKNAQFVINHLIGTPTQKSISRHEHVNIDVLAD